jgi:hypothetical protein
VTAVSEHELHGAHVVDRQAVVPGQQADAACRGQSTHADATVVAGAERPAAAVQCPCHVLPACPGLDPDKPSRFVDHLDAVHGAEVDDESTVVGGPSTDAVTATADSEGHVAVLAGERDRVGDLLRVPRSQHQARRTAAEVVRADAAVLGMPRLDCGVDE